MDSGRTIHDELREKFPEMRPIGSPPTLGSINGFGLKMSGNRGGDPATGTYVKTHCLAALFIPLIAVGAYRVADAENGGWYFLGKERLSGFAKIWNSLLLFAVIGIFASTSISAKRNSPDYIAKKQIEEAQELEANNDFLGAAEIYSSVLDDGSARLDEARTGLIESLNRAFEGSEKPQALGALHLVSKRRDATEIVPDLAPQARTLASKLGDDDPAWAIDALDAALDHVPNELVEAYDKDRLTLLLELNQAAPDDVDYAVRLAGVYERQQEFGEIEPLLTPHVAKLGHSEGARILGQTWAATGNWEGAYPLLQTYLKKHLGEYHKREKDLERIATSIQERWINHLDTGEAPDSFYDAYNAADDAGQNRMVNDFLEKKFEESRPYKKAIDRLMESGDVVSVAMDFGMVQLNRAQSIDNPAERKKLLEEAERTFISVQSSVGESTQTRLNLAQVYFWLGKNREADVLFDQILGGDRNLEDLYLVASTVRDLGDNRRARELLEEAYGKAKEEQVRSQIASLRANTEKDLDDSIEWWAKADQSNPTVMINLATTRGTKALQDGDEKTAIKEYLNASAGYAKQPEGVSVFNNWSLVYMRPHALSGKLEHYRKATELLEKAVKMSPADPILVSNFASTPIVRRRPRGVRQTL